MQYFKVTKFTKFVVQNIILFLYNIVIGKIEIGTEVNVFRAVFAFQFHFAYHFLAGVTDARLDGLMSAHRIEEQYIQNLLISIKCYLGSCLKFNNKMSN